MSIFSFMAIIGFPTESTAHDIWESNRSMCERHTVRMQGHSLAQHDDSGLLPVSITVSIVAVLIALISLLGHRAHSRTIFAQNQAITQWVYYESKATGRTSYDAMLDFLPVAPVRDPAAAGQLKDKYQQKMREIDEEQKKIGATADALENKVARAENAADRFDLGD